MISVIIPTFNEAGIISKTIKQIKDLDTVKSVTEIIVSDGGSTDGTIKHARLAGAKVVSSTKGLATQTIHSFIFFMLTHRLPEIIPDISPTLFAKVIR